MSYSPSEDRPAGTVEMTMPETGSTEAAVVAWLKRPGERVGEGEPVCLVAWDEVTAEVTSPATGVMRMVALATGHPAPTGTSLAVIDTAVLPTRETEEPEPLRVPDSALREAPVADLEPVDLAPTGTPPAVIDTAVLPTRETEEPEPLRVPDSALREAPVADLEPVDLAPTGTPPAVIDTAVLPTRETEEPEPLRVPDSALREAPVADLEPVDLAPTGTPPAVIDTAVLPTRETEEPEPLRVPDSALREAPVADLEPVDLGGYLSPAVRRFSAEHGIDLHSVTGTGRDGRVTLRDLGR